MNQSAEHPNRSTQHEDLPGAALLLQLKERYPDLHVEAVAGYAGFGFDCFLHTVYTLPARRVVDVGERFADASTRLVRDVPVGSSTWKALYRRVRNAVEGRNARLEDWGLKRMPVYGQPLVKALIFLADTLDTLTTLARLVREATLIACLT